MYETSIKKNIQKYIKIKNRLLARQPKNYFYVFIYFSLLIFKNNENHAYKRIVCVFFCYILVFLPHFLQYYCIFSCMLHQKCVILHVDNNYSCLRSPKNYVHLELTNLRTTNKYREYILPFIKEESLCYTIDRNVCGVGGV